MEYQIVMGGGTTPDKAVDSLETKVRSALRLGWKIEGQAFVIPDSRGSNGTGFYSLAQTMIKS